MVSFNNESCNTYIIINVNRANAIRWKDNCLPIVGICMSLYIQLLYHYITILLYYYLLRMGGTGKGLEGGIEWKCKQ